MTNPRIRPALLAAALTLLAAGPVLAAYSLVWSDEFDGASLDLANWSYDIGDGCPDLCGWGNNELQYYRQENVQVFGGNLIITARQESFGGRAFTSGKIHTRDKRSFLYGRMEMRAKLPTGGGMWPAFWMMPQDEVYGGWAASGELDIMESSNATTQVGGALHFGGGWPDNTSTSGAYSLGGTSFADDFHVYAVEWDPDEIRWYVDGVRFMSRTSDQWYSDAAPGNPRAPFDQAFYLILNTAVGGWYTGCTDPTCVTADLPQQYVVDYVRVYQDTGNQAPVVTITTPTGTDNPPAGSLLILADASDPDGTVDRVEFYAGGVYLGEDDAEPYGWLWTGATDGCHTLEAVAVDDEGASGSDTVDVTVGAGCGQAAYPGPTPVLPAALEAEDYDSGGPGVAYNDLTPGNSGNAYRTDEDVDVQVCSDVGGGWNVGWIDAGDWMEYTVEVPADGSYPVDVRVASLSGGGAFRLECGGVDLTGLINVPSTGDWQNWGTLSTMLNLEAGTRVLRFTALSSGFNLNRFDVYDAVVDAPDLPAAGPVLHPARPNPFNPSTTIAFELPAAARASLVVHDVAGRRVRTLIDAVAFGSGRHEATWDGRDAAGRVVPAGVYFARLVADGRARTTRMLMVK